MGVTGGYLGAPEGYSTTSLFIDNQKMSCAAAIDFPELVEGLLDFFSKEKDAVDVDEVKEFMERYEYKQSEVAKYAKWAKYRYTRNLIHEGNDNFNLILMCWPEGAQSAIHDHADSHCFVRVLDGTVKETKYHWPEEKIEEDGSLAEQGVEHYEPGGVTYMSDQLGLHRIENGSHANKLCTIHLYSPPFSDCNIFDARTSKKTKVSMVFTSKFGEKEDIRKICKGVKCVNMCKS